MIFLSQVNLIVIGHILVTQEPLVINAAVVHLGHNVSGHGQVFVCRLLLTGDKLQLVGVELFVRMCDLW